MQGSWGLCLPPVHSLPCHGLAPHHHQPVPALGPPAAKLHCTWALSPSGPRRAPHCPGQARGHTPLLLLLSSIPSGAAAETGKQRNMSNPCKICGCWKKSKRGRRVITAETEMKIGFRVGGGRWPRSQRAKQHEIPCLQAFPVSGRFQQSRELLLLESKEWSRTSPPPTCFPCSQDTATAGHPAP